MQLFLEKGFKNLSDGWAIRVDQATRQLMIYHNGEFKGVVEVDRQTILKPSLKNDGTPYHA